MATKCSYDVEMLETWAQGYHVDEAPVDEMAQEILERRFQRCATCGLWDWPTSGQCKTCTRTEDLQEPDDYCSHWEAEEGDKCTR